MCGVLSSTVSPSELCRGSSPHVRGFAGVGDALPPGTRFIPACAGFCTASHDAGGLFKVHPRMCGVLIGLQGISINNMGSSPHVRGFVCYRGRSFGVLRFIPACAGFCARRQRLEPFGQVHPRMCGVLRCTRPSSSTLSGSSPHVRGFGEHLLKSSDKLRFIPACAGFCDGIMTVGGKSQVHPRMCGVLAPTGSPELPAAGSSPHVRGFASQARQASGQKRFIPACAGFCLPVVHY